MTDLDFDPAEFLPYLLNMAAERASLSFQRAYKDRYGMLRTEWRVMFHLGAYGPMTARQISARAGIHKTKISRAVAALEARRFLSRARQEEDRRSEMLRLTPAGQRAYAELSRIAMAHDQALTEGMSETEQQTLRACLKRIAGAS